MSPVSLVFHTREAVSIGLKKQAQSGKIHSIILDVHVGWQSTQNCPKLFNSSSTISLFIGQFPSYFRIMTTGQVIC